MSFATTEYVTQFLGAPGVTCHGYVLPAGQRLYKGTLVANGDGKVYPASTVVSPNPLFGRVLTVTGGGTGVLYLYSPFANVYYSQVVSGNNTPLSVGVSWLPNSSALSIIVNLATDSGGAATSTASNVAQALWAHPIAAKYLRINTNLALGAMTALTSTRVPQFTILGIADETYDNAAGVTDVTLSMRFVKGAVKLLGLATDLPIAGMSGGEVAVVDNITVKATIADNDLTLPLVEVAPDGGIYCRIS
jgi:hypothetical protein